MAKRWVKRVAAGTALSLGATGIGALVIPRHQHSGQPGAHGAIVNLREDNGMLMTNRNGQPSLFNYFDSTQPEDMVLDVSISTSDVMPEDIYTHWNSLTRSRHDITPQQFRGINPETTEVIRYFFSEFEELTGIRVRIHENMPGADITIGGFIGDHDYIGFASFPHRTERSHGFMMLSMDYINKKLEVGKTEAIKALIAHEFGHNLGLYHPFDDHVRTAMNDLQQDSVARMGYSNHTFPEIAQTDIDVGYGPLDIFLIRRALAERGVATPEINPDNNNYLLSALRFWQFNQATAVDGDARDEIPALSIADSGGENQLTGTVGNDLLVTQSGYCGLLDRDQQRIEILRNGLPFCLVEGEFSVVRGGAGDDLILTANGTEQQIDVGSGVDDVALIHHNIGIKTIITPERPPADIASVTGTTVPDNLTPHGPASEHSTTTTSAVPNIITTPLPGANSTTLTLHYSVIERGIMHATQVGNDIIITSEAFSGRPIGQITLQDQLGGHGIDHVRIVNNTGDTLFERDTADLLSPEAWEAMVIDPAQIVVNNIATQNIRADLDAARQALAGDAGEWTTSDEEDTAVANSSHSNPANADSSYCSIRASAPSSSHVAYVTQQQIEEPQSGNSR